jgi:hypothetical protein
MWTPSGVRATTNGRGRNRPQRRPSDDKRNDDRTTTNGRGRQRSRGDGCECQNGAQRSFGANVIARSVDRATTQWDVDKEDKEDREDKEDKEDKK